MFSLANFLLLKVPSFFLHLTFLLPSSCLFLLNTCFEYHPLPLPLALPVSLTFSLPSPFPLQSWHLLLWSVQFLSPHPLSHPLTYPLTHYPPSHLHPCPHSPFLLFLFSKKWLKVEVRKKVCINELGERSMFLQFYPIGQPITLYLCVYGRKHFTARNEVRKEERTEVELGLNDLIAKIEISFYIRNTYSMVRTLVISTSIRPRLVDSAVSH